MTQKKAVKFLKDHGFRAVEELDGKIFVAYYNFDFCTVVTLFKGGATFQDENGDCDIFYDCEDCSALHAWLGY